MVRCEAITIVDRPTLPPPVRIGGIPVDAPAAPVKRFSALFLINLTGQAVPSIRKPLHSWQMTPKEAVALQRELASQVELRPLPGEPEFVAGCDVSYRRGSSEIFAAIVVIRMFDRKVTEESIVQVTGTFPYIPGLLSFREMPGILSAWEQLRQRPDVVMVDAQGTAHPRKFGLACHLGLWLGLPTMGCAKSWLIGDYTMPKAELGAATTLTHRGEEVGRVLRTRRTARPVFVSPGHLIDCDSSVSVVMALNDNRRIPLPTREAHLACNRARREFAEQAQRQKPGKKPKN